MSPVRIHRIDYRDPKEAAEMVRLLDDYARSPMGGAEGLAEEVRERLPKAMAQRPDALTLLAYDGERAVGLCNAFEGFSTFYAKPLLNIHDIYVDPEYRGQGIARALLAEAERIARERGCCKMTLEVLEGNRAAQASYRRFGFESYRLDPEKGVAQFWQKPLQ